MAVPSPHIAGTTHRCSAWWFPEHQESLTQFPSPYGHLVTQQTCIPACCGGAQQPLLYLILMRVGRVEISSQRHPGKQEWACVSVRGPAAPVFVLTPLTAAFIMILPFAWDPFLLLALVLPFTAAASTAVSGEGREWALHPGMPRPGRVPVAPEGWGGR